ncbi:MAG: ribosome-associated translation inhibitor RaiA [Bdellovibrionales bacterium]|jgi:putative sigma-54 modulation protein|nr:ribosome-associated translation inhibitor RaiA [Bdellovibrionales bacterium]
MKITISFKQLDHTPSLDDMIRKKSEKIAKYLNGKTEVKWTCFVKNQVHFAEITLLGPDVYYNATASSDNLYKSLDLAVEKIEKQISKKKDKLKNKIHRRRDSLQCLEPENAWTDYDEETEGYAQDFFKKVV